MAVAILAIVDIQLAIKRKDDNMKINCTLNDPNTPLPKYESEYASGMDLRAWKYSLPYDLSQEYDFPEEGFNKGLWLQPFQRVLIKTGLHIELPKGMEAQIRPRSGLALKHGITVLNTPGTIDSDFRGEIGVILINLSQDPFQINKGDRIAQLIFARVEHCELNVVNKLSETVRGEGGFGSTKVK